jgi:NAD(P)-dependent dehydrogenase (short-subunit alcohol dehydrogenase family)
MGRFAITGAASGLGATTRRLLEKNGHDVVGVDVRDVEIEADLGTDAGRQAAVAAVRESGPLDGLVVAAGLGPQHSDPRAVASVNYYGAIAVLDGLRDTLAAGTAPAAVAVCSNSATIPGAVDHDFVEVYLAGDEAAARDKATEWGGVFAYASSKRALARAVRLRAQEWGEAGVRLNGIAPGPFKSPMLEGLLADEQTGPLMDGFPIPLGRYGEIDEVAQVIVFLLSPEASFVHAAIWWADGGSDALYNPDIR